ncbi:MAG: hypothetical protein KIT84_15960 [Labilithrix sp.]|nr:hypothetical protein [Labilithrix sp.]MCW5812523.1 hypothetical protein [Labilithrix sp.]
MRPVALLLLVFLLGACVVERCSYETSDGFAADDLDAAAELAEAMEPVELP